MSTQETASTATQPQRSPLADLSNAMVKIYKDQFGRGPTKVRSSFAGPDTVVCLLENTFTPAEKNLQAMGEHQRLRDTRMFFQYASAGDFTLAVEQALDRRVISFISGIDTNTDVACELFTLEPKADGGIDQHEQSAEAD